MSAQPVILHGVVQGKTIILDEDPKLPNNLPVTVRLESLSPRLLSAYGGWKDMPDFENIERKVEEARRAERISEGES